MNQNPLFSLNQWSSWFLSFVFYSFHLDSRASSHWLPYLRGQLSLLRSLWQTGDSWEQESTFLLFLPYRFPAVTASVVFFWKQCLHCNQGVQLGGSTLLSPLFSTSQASPFLLIKTTMRRTLDLLVAAKSMHRVGLQSINMTKSLCHPSFGWLCPRRQARSLELSSDSLCFYICSSAKLSYDLQPMTLVFNLSVSTF